jgi:hypothetical protein
MYVLLLLFIL